MSKDWAREPRSQIRYSGRTVEDEAWIKNFLCWMPFGVLATVHEGQPFVTNNLFVYEEATNALYMHTAQVGRTRSNVEAAPQVVFTVSRMGRLLPHVDPVHFDVEYASVVIFGRVQMIEDLAEKRRVLQLLLDKYAPHLRLGVDYNPIPDGDLLRTSVYRIEIEDWSGKRNEASADFAGAYRYDDVAGG